MEKLGTIPVSEDILRNSAIGLWAFELDEGRPPRMYVDETMAGLLGMVERLSPEETYHAWYDHVDVQHCGMVATAVEKMSAGVHAEVQYPWHHPDGRTVYVRCGGVRNFAYTQGVRLEGCHRDITELVHFQREERRHVVDALGAGYVAIFQFDFPTRTVTALRSPSTYVRREGEDTASFSDYETRFRAYLENEVAEEYRSALAPLADPFATKSFLAGVASREVLVRKKSGDWVRFTFCALGQAEDANVIVAATYLDEASSQRAILQKERAEILEMLRAATWSARISPAGGVLSLDCSDSVRALLGIENPRVDYDRDIRTRIHPDDMGLVEQSFRQAVRSRTAGAYYECECRLRRSDGVYRWFRALARVDRYEDGAPMRVFGVFTDINDAHEKALLAERLSKALEEAKSAEQTKSAFLATMSHEIRTPLNAVIGFAEFLQKMDLTPEERENYLAGITRSSNALLSLINDVLDLSKLDAGKVVVRGGSCNVGRLLDEMRSIFHFNAARKGIEISCEIADDFPSVALKEERVRQILLNLVGNAVKFTEHGRVSCSARWIPGAPGRGTLTVQVRDTGIGIPKEKQGEIFDPFVQADGVRGGKVYQGTGLGLPICRRLVEAVGGEISLESEAGKGATFTVVIPDVEISAEPDVAAEEIVDVAAADVALKAPREIQVVAVDDVPLNLVVVGKFCEMAGVPRRNIHTFLRAGEALKHLREKGLGPSRRLLVFTDMWMPEMTGEEFVRAIRKDLALARVPVVAVTADAETSGSYDMSLFDGVITKPITGAKIKTALVRFTAQPVAE